MIRRTLFFKRNLTAPYGVNEASSGGVARLNRYEDYWWTYPGADYPLAPDTVEDPLAAYRGTGAINRFFKLLQYTAAKITTAKRKRNLVNILGSDWTVDTNELLYGENNPVYAGVTMTLKYALRSDYLCADIPALTRLKSCGRQYDDIVNKLNGKTWWISSYDDPWYIREGRVQIGDPEKSPPVEMVITADAEPVKYEKYSSMDTWYWDDLDFEDGIIRETADYTKLLSIGTSGAARQQIVIIPNDNPESVWIRIKSGDSYNHVVKMKWVGTNDTTAVSYTLTDSSPLLETTFVPSVAKFAIELWNGDELPVGVTSASFNVYIYYRGSKL